MYFLKLSVLALVLSTGKYGRAMNRLSKPTLSKIHKIMQMHHLTIYLISFTIFFQHRLIRSVILSNLTALNSQSRINASPTPRRSTARTLTTAWYPHKVIWSLTEASCETLPILIKAWWDTCIRRASSCTVVWMLVQALPWSTARTPRTMSNICSRVCFQVRNLMATLNLLFLVVPV